MKFLRKLIIFSLTFITISETAQYAPEVQDDLVVPFTTLQKLVNQDIQNYAAFAPNIPFVDIQTSASQRFQQQVQRGLFPQATKPDKVYYSRLESAIIDVIINFNRYLPGYNMAEFFQKARGAVSGDLQLEDLFQFYEQEILTNDNTIDKADMAEIAYTNLFRLQNTLPDVTVISQIELEPIEMPVLPQSVALGQSSNPQDLIPNSSSIGGFECAFNFVNFFVILAQDLPPDKVLQSYDKLIDTMNTVYNFAARIATTPRPT